MWDTLGPGLNEAGTYGVSTCLPLPAFCRRRAWSSSSRRVESSILTSSSTPTCSAGEVMGEICSWLMFRLLGPGTDRGRSVPCREVDIDCLLMVGCSGAD